MTRLGGKLPFRQAAEEVRHSHKTKVKKELVRDVTYRYGEMIEEDERDKVEQLKRKMVEAEAQPETVMVSEDGALIQLKTGEWYEVKTMAVGEVKHEWNQKKNRVDVKTENLSYFSRSYRIREFEEQSLVELHRRGVFNASKVVSVVDGAGWIQSFTDYHFSEATCILDFYHAAEYLAKAGKAVLGDGSDSFKLWYAHASHQLKHYPPQRTFGELALLRSKASSEQQQEVVDTALFYLKQREAMIDYPYFQARHLPIGSGCVESSHKFVVQQRMKQAGMRWAKPHIDPLLAIRNLICNERWDEGWSRVQENYWQKQRASFREKSRQQHPSSPPISLSDVAVAPLPPSPESPPETKSSIPAPDHPWRQGHWPTRESWRWN